MNVAIIGAGAIARSMCRTVRGMKEKGRPVELYAIASRSQEKADAFAKEEGVLHAYGSYEAMLADPAVDLVYIATPHSHHAEQMKMCIRAGKAVLCEKAFTPNLHQAEEVLDLAREKGVYVAEALWPRYMPSRWIINDLLAEGVIGEPRMLYSNLCYAIEHKERIMDPALAGGALLDLGVYVLNFASMVFGDDIVRINSTVELMDTGVDRTETITIKYRDGKMAQLMASTAFNSDRRCVIYGTKGFLIVDNVNNPAWVEIYDKDHRDKPMQRISMPEQITGYEYEVEACLRDLQAGNLEPCEMPHEQTKMLLHQMDALRAIWHIKFPFEQKSPFTDMELIER
ncbi:MAG: Gfo/Idh/MocA family oxidoreductase [Clostridia bacterium]|nr:Gfo/Idh/MocA family oxidoreductase [Clostridia bacterium]